MRKIRPCPRCQSKNWRITGIPFDDHVECKDCLFQGPKFPWFPVLNDKDRINLAIEAWNDLYLKITE